MSIDIKLCELSRPLKAVLFFALNPDKRLTTGEIAKLLDLDPQRVSEYLKYAVVNALLDRTGPAKKGSPNVYGAGRALLKVSEELKVRQHV